MSKRKVAIIGFFAGNRNKTGGQEAKTFSLYDEIKKTKKWEITTVDTFYKRSNPLKLLLQSLVCLVKTSDIIVLLSSNGMKLYFPVLYFFARYFNKRIYHDVIGGNLYELADRYPRLIKYMNSFIVNWVETNKMKEELEKRGVLNCDVIPNFKRLKIVSEEEIDQTYEEPFRFCTFSRVVKEKGIEDAIEAIEELNAKYCRKICELDIYGSIDEKYKEDFQKLMDKSTDAISYCGMVPFNKSVETIRGYYALLFPTHWKGEGFPGTIVDAFSAGLPVIATDWNYNSEIIDNYVNGILYPKEDILNLTSAIDYMINNASIYQMKKDCIKKAELYQPDFYISKIVSKIEGLD
jgi:glycosyltransferase involved in cell wall biosynthesis